MLPLTDLERLLSVSLIMTPVDRCKCVQIGTSAGEALALLEPDYTQAPLMDGPYVQGMIDRTRLSTLRESELVGNQHAVCVPILCPSDPLSRVIGLLVDSPSVLILEEAGALAGLVHFSDLNKHSVRLLFYFLLSGLEMSFAAAIRDEFAEDDAWLKHLKHGRLIGVLGLTEWQRRYDLRIDAIEATELSDVVEVVRKEASVRRRVGLDTKAAAALGGLVELRHATMHPVRRFVRSHQDVRRLQGRLSRLRELLAFP